MRPCLALVLVLTGCDVVFGLGRPALDAPIADARPTLDAPGCATAARTAAVEASVTTTIAMANVETDQQYAAVNSKGGQRALWKFPVPSVIIGRPILDIRLVLPHLTRHPICGTSTGPCDDCAALEMAGDLDVYAVTSDWDAATANWSCRRMLGPCLPWGSGGEGGAGGDSRGPRVGGGARTPATTTIVTLIDRASPFTFEGGGPDIALLAQATVEDGTGVTAMMPGTTTVGGSCMVDERVVLEIDYCPP